MYAWLYDGKLDKKLDKNIITSINKNGRSSIKLSSAYKACNASCLETCNVKIVSLRGSNFLFLLPH